MLKSLLGYIKRSFGGLQEQGFIRTGAGISAPPDLFPQNDWGTVTEASAKGLPAFKRGLEILSNRIGLCRCYMYRREADGGREQATEHPLYNLLRRQAAVNMSATDLFRKLAEEATWNGNSYAWIAPNYSGLNMLDPSTVTPVVIHGLLTQQIYYLVQRGTEKQVLDSSEIIHIKSALTSACGLVGVRLLDVARNSLALAQNEITYSNNFFKFGGVADTWIELPNGAILDDQQEQALFQTLTKKYSGNGNSRSPLIIGGGGKLNKTVLTNADSQLLDSRAWTYKDVACLIGISAHHFDGTIPSQYGTLEQANAAELSITYEPILRAIESELEWKLLTTKERELYYIEFDRGDLTRADEETDEKIWTDRLSNGKATWQEYRKAHNKPTKLAKDERWYLPANLQIYVGDELTPVNSPAPAAPETGTPGLQKSPENAPNSTPKPQAQGQQIAKRALERLKNRLIKDNPASYSDLIGRHQSVFDDALGAPQFTLRFFGKLGDELSAVLPEQRALVLNNIDVNQLSEELWIDDTAR